MEAAIADPDQAIQDLIAEQQSEYDPSPLGEGQEAAGPLLEKVLNAVGVFVNTKHSFPPGNHGVHNATR
jgi:hypothetical protein